MERLTFLGFPVDNMTIAEALAWIMDSVRLGQPRIILVSNANKLWLASKDQNLTSMLKEGDLIVPEYAITWGARRLGFSINHVGGITLLQAFLPVAERHRIKLYFLGATAAVVGRLVQQLTKTYPRLLIAGHHHGYIQQKDIREMVVSDLKDKRPDVLFVAMGSPQQERFIREVQNIVSIPVMMGVGGSFDVLSGLKQDAPPWARGKGLEWVYRILQDPGNRKYYKRYLVTNVWFVFQIMRQIFGYSNL